MSPPSPPEHQTRSKRIPGVAAALFRATLPYAERDEVIEDLASEYADRAAADGRIAARIWVWRQLFGSLPALVRRSWWRGWTGFEPRANRMRPGGFVMESWIIDLRYSARRIAGRPLYTLLAVVTLALAAGGTAAIFSVVRALLLDPLPVAREQQLGVLWFDGSWTQQEFLHFRPSFPGFQRMAAYMNGDQTLERNGEALRLVHGIVTSAELFDVLGVKPLIGRAFQDGDDVEGAAPAVVLSYGLWQELGGDPSIIGRQLRLGGTARTVAGVMPPGFWFPSPTVRLWTAASLTPEDRIGNWTLIGRVNEGASVVHMEAPLRVLATELGRRFKYPAQWDKTRAPAIQPLREFLVGDVRTPLLATLAAMGLILLIACVNVAALMLGQVSSRSTELAVRAALGAGRQRLVQQLALESLMIGTPAGASGAAVAAAVFRTLIEALPLGAFADTTTLDWRVFLAATAFALLASSLIAVIPGAALARGNLQGSLSTVRTGGISGRGGRFEGALVVAQITLAMLLTAGAGLLLRSAGNLRAVDPGFRVKNIAVLDVTMPTEASNEQRHRLVLDMLPVLGSLPHVSAVAAAQKIPLRGSGDNFGVAVRGKPDLAESSTPFRTVTHDYFKVMGISIRRGRGFEPADRMAAEPVVVINEAMAAKYFPGEDPIGRVLMTFDEHGERIIGVVENVAEERLTDAPLPARYMLYEHVPVLLPATSFVLSGEAPEDVPRLMDAARHALQRDGRMLAVERTISMASVFEDAVGAPGRVAALLSLLAGLAMALGAVGVYGMISHFVARRTREYGLRLALGLPPGRVVSQIVGRGLGLVVCGIVIGIIAAVMLTRLLSSLLYGVRATDPQALAGALLALLIVGALAAFIPARRASRTDPATVLREQ